MYTPIQFLLPCSINPRLKISLLMSYDLSKRLVIGLASSALFDLSESDNIFRTEGAETYRQYQREKQNHPLKEGVAFPFIKKLLSINEINPNDPSIEVILLSKNNPDTGLQIMNPIYFFEQTYYPIQQYAYFPLYFLAAGVAGLAGAFGAGAPTEA